MDKYCEIEKYCKINKYEEINLFHVNSEVWRVQKEPVLDEKVSRAEQICGVSFTFFRLHVSSWFCYNMNVREKHGLLAT